MLTYNAFWFSVIVLNQNSGGVIRAGEYGGETARGRIQCSKALANSTVGPFRLLAVLVFISNGFLSLIGHQQRTDYREGTE